MTGIARARSKALSLTLILLCLPRTSVCQPAHDLMTNLPGHDGDLEEDWYSGYLHYDVPFENGTARAVHTHYVYVDSGSDDSPLIFWTNGGPGASSLYGLFAEFGPFLLNGNSMQGGVPRLFHNEFGWHSLGSILVFDAPAPVGFSHCGDPTAMNGCGGWDDASAARNNYLALQAFHASFPGTRERPLYLTGESYAGIYVPTMARLVVEGGGSNLKGMAVGDGCVGSEVNCGGEARYWNLWFLAGHGQISMKTFEMAKDLCGETPLKTPGFLHSNECMEALAEARSEAGGFFEYGLYDDCTYQNDFLSGIGGAVNDYACGGGAAMEEYLRSAEVREAFHVPVDAAFVNGDNGIGLDYEMTEKNLMPFHYDLAAGKYAHLGIRQLIYDGDADPSINSFVAQNWTSSLGLKEKEKWRGWTLDGCKRMGGYITRYEGAFDFLTIRGAGHMVPTNKPEATWNFMKNWLGNYTYPEYHQDCQVPQALEME